MVWTETTHASNTLEASFVDLWPFGSWKCGIGDKGYRGHGNRILVPFATAQMKRFAQRGARARRMKAWNHHQIESIRALSENCIHRLKLIKGISKKPWRFTWQSHKKVVHILCSIANIEFRLFPVWHHPPKYWGERIV